MYPEDRKIAAYWTALDELMTFILKLTLTKEEISKVKNILLELSIKLNHIQESADVKTNKN